MNPEETAIPGASSTCPRCGSGTSNVFGYEGLCLRCAGLRVLELETGSDSPWEEPHEERPLERIGPYEIIEELGHGGMGKVYAARQPGLGRIVAVKAIREGMDARLDIRFQREVQTVAALRHPNIVVVHESGRSGGNLYFSMDYIEGGDLAARLRVEALAPRDAALLMSKVADALAYSHEKGVLHRDLKPSNILLDGSEPKLADFGLAAQIEPGGSLTAATHVLGTPHYLAPEAVAGGSAALTVASDVYSAGVILFEMLTGRTPFAGASAAELPALLSDADPPSVRLLAPAVPRDLETICLKCLERDPSRRYAGAADLAGDLRRYLAGEHILARPASAWYRLRRFERRHRLAVVSACLVAATLVAATALSLRFASKAREAERNAAAESATSKAVVDFLQHDLLEQAAPDEQPDRDIKLSTVVDRAAAKVGDRFRDKPEVELGVRESLALTYESLADYAGEKAQIERAAEIARRLYGPEDRRTLADEGEQALLLARTGRVPEAKAMLTDVIRLESRVLGPDARQTIHSTNDLVFIEHQMGRIQEAEALAKETLDRATRALGPMDPETLAAETDLSSMYFWEGRYREAAPLNEHAIQAFTRLHGAENPTTLLAMGNLAAVYANEGRMQDAQAMDEKIYEIRRRVLGPEHPDTLRILNNLGSACRQNGLLERAEECGTLSYGGRLKILGPSHPDTIMSQSNLVLAKLERGKVAEADALGTQGLEAALKAVGADHYATLGIENALSEVKLREGRLDEAERLRAAIHDSRLRHGGPENYNTLGSALALALVKVQLGRFAEAETLLRPVIIAWDKTRPGDWRALQCRNLMGAALAGQRRFGEAEALLVSSAEGLERRSSEVPAIDRHLIGEADKRVAEAYGAWGRADKASDWDKRAAAFLAK
jgi:tetratricopeptide (TPR) repeat protein